MAQITQHLEVAACAANAFNLRAIFTPSPSFHANATSLAVALFLAELQYMWAFNLHELFECADLKYTKLGSMVTP